MSSPKEMRNLSEMVEIFTIDPFSDSENDKGPEFINIFEKPKKERVPEKSVNVEEEARKIFEDAFAQGERAGHEMGMKKVEQAAKRFTNYLAELAAFKERLVREAEQLSVELALVFAEAVILRECSEKREILIEMARKAFEVCEDKREMVLRVRREDACRLESDVLTNVKIVPDDGLKEPGFIIETAFGDIDGRISTQIEELRREFLHERAL